MTRNTLAVALAVVLAALSLSISTASAEPSFEARATELVTTVAKRAARNLRRSIAIGPFMAPAIDYAFDGGSDLQVAGGIALYTFDVPLLVDKDRLIGFLRSRAQDMFKERLAALASGGREPTDQDLERLAEEVWADVKSSFERGYQPKRLEKPRLALRLEVGYRTDAADWEIRTSAAIGAGPIFVSPGAMLAFMDRVFLMLPIEVSKPIVFGSGVRTMVVDVFARVDIAAHGRDENSDRFIAGARLLLDLL